MMYYYEKPDPNEFPNWLQDSSAVGLLKEEQRQFPFLGFSASIFAANDNKIATWMRVIDKLPERDRKNVLYALRLSGAPFSKIALSEETRKKIITGENYFNFETDKDPPSMDSISHAYMGYLDIQWGRFFATGEEKPVRNIILFLQLSEYLGSQQKHPRPKTDEERDSVIKEILFKTAAWSLDSNCRMHPRVLEICEKVYRENVLSPIGQVALQNLLHNYKPEKYKRNLQRYGKA